MDEKSTRTKLQLIKGSNTERRKSCLEDQSPLAQSHHPHVCVLGSLLFLASVLPLFSCLPLSLMFSSFLSCLPLTLLPSSNYYLYIHLQIAKYFSHDLCVQGNRSCYPNKMNKAQQNVSDSLEMVSCRSNIYNLTSVSFVPGKMNELTCS